MTTERTGRALRSAFSLLIALAAFLTVSPAWSAEVPRPYIVMLQEKSVGQLLPRQLRVARRRVRLANVSLVELTQQVVSAQKPAKIAIEAEGVEITGSVSHTINAIFVRATRDQARRLRQLAGVTAVVRTPKFKLMLNEAAGLIQAPAAWETLGGASSAGAGIKIGIIDTGIDRDHPAFADESLAPPAGFPKARPEDLAFTSNKIIVARSYVAILSSALPEFSRPDDFSPRDRIGHGTAVAMIAAGGSVTSPLGTLRGIAPQAYLGNYKIFGSADINDFSSGDAVITAIDDAVLDGMDIISISFGAVAQYPFDEQGEGCFAEADILCDPVAMAAQSAMEEWGVVVVAAAGNAGALGEQRFPALNSIATPGSAAAVITVGASVNSRQLVQSIGFGGETFTALSGGGPKLGAPLTLHAADGASLGNQLGCGPFPAGLLANLIVLVDRGGCSFESKVDFAARAGARGVVVRNLDGEESPFVMSDLETTDIPAFMIGSGDGIELRNGLAGDPGIEVTLDPALSARPVEPDQVAPFSSRGPSPGNGIKPELVAPGTFIYSGAQRFDPNGDTHDPSGFSRVDGTSFAAPMVAGAAALVLQRNPEFLAIDVKSALVNTASTTIFENGELARLSSVGAGLLDVRAALDPVATAAPATISFGAVGFGAGGGTTFPVERAIQIYNPDSVAHTFFVSVLPRDENPSAEVLVDGDAELEIELGGGEFIDLPVRLEGSAPAAGSYEGFIQVARDTGGLELLIPFYYVVGDGVPFNSFVISGTGVVGTAGEPHPELLIFRVIDIHGQPVANLPVDFSATAGGGVIVVADSATDRFGIAAADVDMGPEIGPQTFEAVAGGLAIPFFNAARAKPVIGAIVDAASFSAETPVAPGSIVSVFGENLAEFEGSISSLPLPIALKHASVSFDFPEQNISVPGRFYYADDRQANLQIPWELAGLNFVFVKMRIEDSASEVFRLDLAREAPGIFEFSFEAVRQAVVTHLDGTVATPSNPASPGETVIVYATGLGPVTQAQSSGEPPAGFDPVWTQSPATVEVGGLPATVQFAGLTPGLVGLYQVNITLPAGLPAGNLTLVIIINGVASNVVVIPVG